MERPAFWLNCLRLAPWRGLSEKLWVNRDQLENMGKAGAIRAREMVPARPDLDFFRQAKTFD